MAFAGRFRELMKKYGKVALGVHFSVSAASITSLYVAIKNNVDVESLFERVGLGASKKEDLEGDSAVTVSDRAAIIPSDEDTASSTGRGQTVQQPETRNRTAELAASSGGALAVAILLNKALFPVRVPITIALTPPISRFLARRNLIKSHGIH